MCLLGMSGLQGAYAALELLGDAGWSVVIGSHPLGIEITARRGAHVVRQSGPTVADVTQYVVDACRRAGGTCAL